jgi:NodT family efflux transporter outer membrane factor (OMF) lipoprotein
LRAFHASLVVLLLSGCATTPYAPPTAAVPTAYRVAPTAPTLQDSQTPTQTWWTVFGDPRLNEFIERALSDSLDVEVARARLDQAQAGVRASASNALPLIGASATGGIQRQSLEEPLTRALSRFPAFDRTAERYGLNLAASWELDLFGGLAAERRGARADADAARAGVEGARLTVAAETANAYFSVVEFRRRIQVAEARIATLTELDRIVALRVARSVAPRLDRDQVMADLEALQAAKVSALNRLDVLGGRSANTTDDAGWQASTRTIPGVAVDPPAALVAKRPDLIAAERSVAAADAGVARAIASRYPRLSLSGLVGLLSGGIGNLFGGDATTVAASGDLTGPVLDFGRGAARVSAARARTREAVASYRSAVLRAGGEIDDATTGAVRARDQLAALDRSAASLEKAITAARLAYRSGAISLIDVLDTERRLQLVQDSIASADGSARRAVVSAYRAQGG